MSANIGNEKKAHLSSHPVPPPSSAALLDKVGYDMSAHPAESADWLNVLFSQVSLAWLASDRTRSLIVYAGCPDLARV